MKLHYLFIIVFFFCNTLDAQSQNNEVIAKINNQIISTTDFKKLFELSPMVYNTVDVNEKKEIFLLSMAAQKLWAVEAENLQPWQNPLIKYSLLEIKNKLIRDELYKNDVLNKVNISSDELKDAIKKYKIRLNTLIFTSNSPDIINIVYDKLQSGVSPDSLNINDDNLFIEPVEVSYGDMLEDYENILYSLDPGGYSAPLQTEAGYTIFYLINSSPNLENLSKSNDEIYSSAKSALEKHKINKQYTLFNKNFLGGIEITADIKLFNKLSKLISEAPLSTDKNNQTSLSLSFYESFGLKKYFSQGELNSPFVKFKTAPVTLIDFLGRLGFEGIKLPDGKLETVQRFLSGWIKNFIRMEFLAREAYKRGYDKLPVVLDEYNMWKENYYSVYAMKTLIDSVKISEEEYKQFIESEGGIKTATTFYKVSGIKTTSLEKINDILTGIDEGKEKNSLFKHSGGNNSEIFSFDYLPAEQLGEIGMYVTSMEKGEVYGPLSDNNFFTIIYLEDTRTEQPEGIVDQSNNIKTLKSKYYQQKLEKIIEDKTVQLAEKYSLEINTEILEGIKVNEINIVVMRSFGFGEKMLAAPMLNRQYTWFKKWLEKKKESL